MTLTDKKLKKAMQYTDEILDIIDIKDKVTTSDFQGMIQGIVLKIMKPEPLICKGCGLPILDNENHTENRHSTCQ